MIDDYDSPLPQVHDYGIDVMHSADGGCGRLGFCILLRVGLDGKEAWKTRLCAQKLGSKDTKIYLSNADLKFEDFRRCLSNDFARKPRELSAVNLYKTIEMKTAIVRFVPALLQVPKVAKYLDKSLAANFMNYVVFTRLVGNFSTRPLPQVSSDSYCSWQMISKFP